MAHQPAEHGRHSTGAPIKGTSNESRSSPGEEVHLLDGIAAASTAQATAQAAAQVQIFALKAAQNQQAQIANALIQTLSQGPAHLGNRVDATA
jgi:long-subunit fatty acid transport protein